MDAAVKAKAQFWPVVDSYVFPKPVPAIYAAGEQNHVPLLAGWNADEIRMAVTLNPNKPTLQSFTENAKKQFGDHADAIVKAYGVTSDADAFEAAASLGSDSFIGYSTWKWIETHLATGKSPVYRYSFDRKIPVPEGNTVMGRPATSADIGARHAGEIEYVFGSLALSLPKTPWTDEDRKLSDEMTWYWANFARTGDPNGPGLATWPKYTADSRRVMHLDVTVKDAPEANRARYEALDAYVKQGGRAPARIVTMSEQANEASPAAALFRAQRGYGIDSGRAPRRQPRRRQAHRDRRERDHGERDRIGRRHPEQEPLQHARHAEGAGEADDHAGGDDAERAGEHEAQHIAALGAERHAHADFAAPLRHRVRHQSVDAARRDQRRGDREERQQHHPEPRRRHRRRHRFVHRPRGLDRQIGRGAANFRADAFGDAGRAWSCARRTTRTARNRCAPAGTARRSWAARSDRVPSDGCLRPRPPRSATRRDRSRRTRRPSASPGPPGKYSRTMRSLTIATFGASAVSRSVKSRPASSGIPIVLK